MPPVEHPAHDLRQGDEVVIFRPGRTDFADSWSFDRVERVDAIGRVKLRHSGLMFAAQPLEGGLLEPATRASQWYGWRLRRPTEADRQRHERWILARQVEERVNVVENARKRAGTAKPWQERLDAGQLRLLLRWLGVKAQGPTLPDPRDLQRQLDEHRRAASDALALLERPQPDIAGAAGKLRGLQPPGPPAPQPPPGPKGGG